MAVTELFERPPRGVIPLSKGGDLVIDFRHTIDGVLTDYDAGVSVVLVVDSNPQILSIATIVGYHATCRIESNNADNRRSGS